MPRQVRVDDNDPSVSYSLGWDLVEKSQDPGEIFGPNFQGTLHQTTGAGNFNLTVRFRGYHAVVYGVSNTTTVNGADDPSYDCFVDSLPIRKFDPVTGDGSANNWILCAMDSEADGEHVLTVNVTSAALPFQFDRIQFVPGTGYSIEEASIFIPWDDGALVYDADWVDLDGAAMATGKKGSKVVFPFIGKSLAWGAILPGGLPREPSTGTYSVDDLDPVAFNIPGMEGTAPSTLYNQILFTTPDLEPGRHTIEVTYQGTTADQTPLSLNWLLVTNATFMDPDPTGSDPSSPPPSTPTNSDTASSNTDSGPSPSDTGFSPGNPTDTLPDNPWPTTPSQHDNSSNEASPATIGGIVGGIVGGAGLITIIAILLWFWCRRKNHRRERWMDELKQPRPVLLESPPPEPVPYMEPMPEGVMYSTNGLVLPPSKAQLAGGMQYGAPYSHAGSSSAASGMPSFYPPPASGPLSTGSHSSPSSPYGAQFMSSPLYHTPTQASHGSGSNEVPTPPSDNSSQVHLSPVNNTPVHTQPDVAPPPIVVVHQDSGIRMRPRVEDVPPMYTAD